MRIVLQFGMTRTIQRLRQILRTCKPPGTPASRQPAMMLFKKGYAAAYRGKRHTNKHSGLYRPKEKGIYRTTQYQAVPETIARGRLCRTTPVAGDMGVSYTCKRLVPLLTGPAVQIEACRQHLVTVCLVKGSLFSAACQRGFYYVHMMRKNYIIPKVQHKITSLNNDKQYKVFSGDKIRKRKNRNITNFVNLRLATEVSLYTFLRCHSTRNHFYSLLTPKPALPRLSCTRYKLFFKVWPRWRPLPLCFLPFFDSHRILSHCLASTLELEHTRLDQSRMLL